MEGYVCKAKGLTQKAWERGFLAVDLWAKGLTKVKENSCRTLQPNFSRCSSLQSYAALKWLGRSADVKETEGISTPTEERGDLLIRNIWKQQTDCILDVRITNLDTAPSNIHRNQEAVLRSHEREKKTKYLQRRHVSPFVVSTDGVLENEANVVPQPWRKPFQWIRKVLFRNFKLDEVNDEHCN